MWSGIDDEKNVKQQGIKAWQKSKKICRINEKQEKINAQSFGVVYVRNVRQKAAEKQAGTQRQGTKAKYL